MKQIKLLAKDYIATDKVDLAKHLVIGFDEHGNHWVLIYNNEVLCWQGIFGERINAATKTIKIALEDPVDQIKKIKVFEL